MTGLMQGKVAIVSGAGAVGGLGHESALVLAKEGAKVVIAARTEASLKEAARTIEQAGGTVLAVPTDISDPGSCARLVEATIAEFGQIDTLVNSAFTASPRDLFAGTDLNEWRKLFDVNFFGTAQLIQQVIPHMKKRETASIVNILAHIIFDTRKTLDNGMLAYSCSKNALNTLTQVLALELAPFGIRVNSHVPGYMDGPSVRKSFERLRNDPNVGIHKDEQAVIDGIPLGFIPTSEDCAKAVLFFASDDLSRAVTGQALLVNGGEVLH